MLGFLLSFGSPVDSPSKRIDPLLHSYSDYEDSIYGNSHNSLGIYLSFN